MPSERLASLVRALVPKLGALLSTATTRRGASIVSRVPTSRNTRAHRKCVAFTIYIFFFLATFPHRSPTPPSNAPLKTRSELLGSRSSSFPFERIIPNKRELSRVGRLICAQLKLFRVIRFPFRRDRARSSRSPSISSSTGRLNFPSDTTGTPPVALSALAIFHLIRTFVVCL